VTLVVDASVACKWFIAEAQSQDAVAILARGDDLLAPDLIVPEVCNVAWQKLRRHEIDGDQAAAMVSGLPDMIDELVPSARLTGRAFEIAKALDHPVYDCLYLALAESRELRMVTADRRLLTRLRRTPWARVAIGLGDNVARR